MQKTYSNIEQIFRPVFFFREDEDLWSSMETIDEINSLVSLWLLTLEKHVRVSYQCHDMVKMLISLLSTSNCNFFQGCYNLVKAGADGVIQAMVLSFGSFRFSKQHLEFNMHPSFLHRTYHFRRVFQVND